MRSLVSLLIRQTSELGSWLALVCVLVFGLGVVAHLITPAHLVAAPVALATQGSASLQLALEVESGATLAVPTEVNVRLALGADDGTWLTLRNEVLPAGKPVGGLPSGRYWLIVEAAGFARYAESTVLYGESQRTVRLRPAAEVNVEVVDVAGAPVRDATVLIRDPELLPFGALSDAQGKVRFSRVEKGQRGVEVFARGYEPETRVVDARIGTPATLRVVLQKLSTLRVTVLTPDATPAAAAEVWIVGARLWPARRIATDAKGVAELTGLGEGSFDLRARSGNLVSAVNAAVRLNRGESRELTLQLVGGRFVEVEVVAARAEGVTAVPGARVVLAEQGLSSFPFTAVTPANGKVKLGPISPVSAYVSARAEGFISRGGVAVGEGASQSVRVELVEGATIRGTVVDEGGFAVRDARVEVVGFDLDGQPVAETPLLAAYREAHFDASLQPVALVPAGELGITLGPVPFVNEAPTVPGFDTLPPDYMPWTSDDLGRFKAGPVPPGKLRVLVRHTRYADALSQVVSVGPGGVAEVSVVLPAGAQLSGRVLDDRGFPVSGSRVRVTATRGTYDRSSYTAADGTFMFDALPAEVTVALARPEEPSRFVVRDVVTLPSGGEVSREFTLPEPREAVEFRVVDGADAPLEVAQVTLLSLDPRFPLRASRFTDADGRVRIDDAAGLRARITVQSNGYTPVSEQFAHAPTTHTFTLVRGVWVTGKVTAVRGRQPAVGARVTLESASRRDTTYTSSLGEYEFRNVPPGAVTLSAEHDDYARSFVRFTVEPPTRDDRAVELPTLDLSEAGTISGVVLDAMGEPVSGARVALEFLPAYLPRGAEVGSAVRTDAEGRFRLLRVEAGSHRIYALAAGRGRAEAVLSVEAERELSDVELRLSGADAELDADARAGLAVTLAASASNPSEVFILNVAPTSEAERAGLRALDRLIEIDGRAVDGLSAARERLSGPAGSDVVLRVERRGVLQEYRVSREELTQVR